MRKRCALLLGAALMALLALGVGAAALPAGAAQDLFFPLLNRRGPAPSLFVAIMHTNDLHGYLEASESGRGGAARLAGLVEQQRRERGASNVLLLDAGDFALGGPPIAQLALGESVVDIYNRMGYHAVAAGNHEFDKGEGVLIGRSAQSGFPWLAANVVVRGTAWQTPAWARPYVVLSAGPPEQRVRVGIIGLAATETPAITIAGATAGLEFKDPTETVLRYYDEVRRQSDVVILLAHVGPDGSGAHKGTRRIAQELNDAGKPPALIIGGHQHLPTPFYVTVGGTRIVQAGYHGLWLGQTELQFAGKTFVQVSGYRQVSVSAAAPADAHIAERVAYWAGRVAPLIGRAVGVAAVRLTRDYNAESNLGNLTADGMRWKADALDDGLNNGSVQIALTNPGGLRANIEPPAGAGLPFTITWGATFNVLPFGNTLFLMDLTGAQLQGLLNQSASLQKGMLQTSGATWHWRNDCRCKTPTRWGAERILVSGQSLEPARLYRVVTNDFLAAGQDGWTTFAAGVNRLNTYYDMQEGVNDYIGWHTATSGPIRHVIEGRSVYVP